MLKLVPVLEQVLTLVAPFKLILPVAKIPFFFNPMRRENTQSWDTEAKYQLQLNIHQYFDVSSQFSMVRKS